MKKLIAISLLSLMASASAVAADKKTDKSQTAKLSTFALLDSNADGFITPTEAKSLKDLSVIFKELDTNGDQRISKEEFAKFKPRSR